MITWHCFQKPLNSSIAEKLKQKIFSRWERPVRLQPQLSSLIFEVAVQSEPKTQHTQECEFLRLWQLTACSSTVTVDVSVLQFLLIFRRAAAGELQEESGLMALARLSEINVSTEGVMGAKDFFEAKVTGHCFSLCRGGTESPALDVPVCAETANVLTKRLCLHLVDRYRLCPWAASLRLRSERKKRKRRDRKWRRSSGRPPSSSCSRRSAPDRPEDDVTVPRRLTSVTVMSPSGTF